MRALGLDGLGRLRSVAVCPEGVACTCAGGYCDALPAGATGLVTFAHAGGLVESAAVQGIAGYPPYTISYGRDALLRLTSETLSVGGLVRTHGYAYDGDGAVASLVAPNGVGLVYDHDGPGGRLEGWTTAAVQATSLRFSEYGELAGWATTRGATVVHDVELERDWLGRIARRTEILAGGDLECTYAYDDDGRLESADCGGGAVTYTYDGNGNRLSRSTAAGVEAGTYDAQDRLLLLTLPGGVSVDYDYSADGWLSGRTRLEGGVVVQDDGFVYDAEGRLRSATVGGQTVSYGYDPMGHRIARTVGATTRLWVYGKTGTQPLAEVTAAGEVVAEFAYGARGLPALAVYDGVTYEVLADHLGSYRGLVEVATGALSGVVSYDEYGRVTAGAIPSWIPFGWAGGITDPLTGWVRFGARDYDPDTGRWTDKDSAGLAGGLDLYEYAAGDPVNLVDPGGANPVAVATALAVGSLNGLLYVIDTDVANISLNGYLGAVVQGEALAGLGSMVGGLLLGAEAAGAACTFAATEELGAGRAAQAATSAVEAAGGARGAFSRILGFTERNLQKGFTKHGADFGMTGNWNPSRAADFSRAVNQHINAPGVRSITGTYRGNPVTHYVDPNTGLNVIADQAGNYVSGWRLGAEQLESVLTTGRLF